MTDINDSTVPAGDFSTWLADIQAALGGEADSDVPCDGCTACCAASQFVHISPTETDALAHIPRQLLFPAPGRPKGHVLLGYDERGHCPMLVDNACTVYEHRPRTCRTYDCRVFPATGVDVGEEGKFGIAERAGRWRFTHPTHVDRAYHDACRAAAAYMTEHRVDLAAGAVPASQTQLAVLAVEVHASFLSADGSVDADPGVEAVAVAITSRRARPA